MYAVHGLRTLLSDGVEAEDSDKSVKDPNLGRFVRYQFTPQFLRLKVIGATYVLLFC